MKKTNYKVDIKAPVAQVFDRMLSKPTYEQWTAPFNPSSTYEGSWDKGSKILFVGTGKEGKKEGMVAEIAENIPNKFISIRHRGMLDGDKEITEGPAVENWAGALENYSFNEKDGTTTVTVEVDTHEDYVDYFDEAWPKALNKLKEICEN